MGDSIFDNRAYTQSEPDVATHLRGLLPYSANVTVCAIDGSVTSDLQRQIGRVPADASHVVVSIRGNDTLRNTDLLTMSVSSTAQALSLFRDRIVRFESAYRKAIEAAVTLRRTVLARF